MRFNASFTEPQPNINLDLEKNDKLPFSCLNPVIFANDINFIEPVAMGVEKMNIEIKTTITLTAVAIITTIMVLCANMTISDVLAIL